MTTAELVDGGTCTGCGRPRWSVPICTCGHSVTAHQITPKGVRGACTNVTGATFCTCKHYERSEHDAS